MYGYKYSFKKKNWSKMDKRSFKKRIIRDGVPGIHIKILSTCNLVAFSL